MGRPNIEAIYPLSPMQQGMLFHSLVAPETGVYMEQTTCTLRGPLDALAFERAWQRVVDRHDILRTAFIWKRVEKMLQAVHRQVTVRLEQYDWRGRSAKQQEAEMRALLRVDRERGFDLSRPPLMRLALVRVADDVYRFLWSHHHILLDGWSLPLLLKQVLGFYGAFRQGRDLYLPPARHYRDYINWLRQQDTSGDETFWRETLRGFRAATPLVVDRATPVDLDQPRYRERSQRLTLSETQALQALARQHGLTLNTLVQGAWAVLLSRYTGSVEPADGQDIVFGVTVSGRPADLPGAEEMVGLFINTLPLRVRVSPDMPLVPWLQALQAQQADLRQYERSPLAEVQRWSDVPAGQPLFENILVFENYPREASLLSQSEDLRIEDILSFEQTNYPLTVVGGMDSELVLKVSYDASRFTPGAIERLLGHWSSLLLGMLGDAAAASPQTVGDLPMLTPAERRQLLVTWNETPRELGPGLEPRAAERTVCQWFEEQARSAPKAIAVTSLGAQPGSRRDLTYEELNERAAFLARYLRARGVGPEVMVGLCMERSWEVLVGVLGILKAGGAYVPLDPSYPADRLAFMLRDLGTVAPGGGAPLLLTQERLRERLPLEAAGQVICLDADWDQIAQAAAEDPGALSGVGPDTLAYVIYTSGSTGKPKGTLLVHRGLSNLIRYMIPLMELDASGSMLQFASLSFDASIIDLFAPLAAGARLVMAPQGTLASVPDLLDLLRREHITAVTLPPALLRLLPHEGLPDLHCVISAGEACPPEVAARWAETPPEPGATRRLFFNGYGPTETTVAATYYPVRSVPEGATTIPIGRPVDHVRLYVLDASLRPVPVGVPGELCIGGVGVGRGYLNRPELTAYKFVPDPFVALERQPFVAPAEAAGPRMYRSGDLVRYREDGNLEFLGRIDQQVKIRGYRIELGEIEAFLEQHEGVQQAVVLAREDTPGDKRLVAYVLPTLEADDAAPRAPVTVDQLRAWVRQGLPAYMAPSAYLVLDRLPLTPSGKVDRPALAAAPHGEMDDRAGEPAHVAPRTPVEGVLVGIFEQVLGAERVGIRDNFFDLGGHSLLATQAASRLRNVLGVDLPLQDLFEAPTVETLAERVERLLGAGVGKAPAIAPVPRALGQPLPLSFSQERLWFLDQLAPGNLYNIPIAAKLSGALHQGALEAGLREIVRRHEILRTTFRAVRGVPVQEAVARLDIPLALTDLSALPRSQREAAARRLVLEQAGRSFDLAQGPLLRAHLIKLGKEEHVLLLAFHHIVFDGWSADVFLSELATLYGAYAASSSSGAPETRRADPPVPPLDIQYADYAVWQRAWLQGEVLQQQMAYWESVLTPLPPTLALPTDHPRPAVQSWLGGAEDFDLSPELLRKLSNVGRAEGTTLFMTLLAAFQVLLYRYTGQEDLSIGSPIANRHHPGVDKLIGFFVNTLVLRADLSGSPTFRQLLQRARKAALDAYAHQDVPFEMLVEKLHPQRDLSHNPLFQVAFTVQAPSSTGPLQAGLDGLQMTPWPIDGGTAKFDLTLILSEGAEGLSGTFEYNRDLFAPATIRRMIGHLRTLLEAIALDVAQPIATLPLLTPAEKQQMLVEWNRTKLETPVDRCAHQLFEAQAARQPEAIAVILDDQALSYGELDRRANQLANYLRELGVGEGADHSPRPDMLVGILMERSLETVVGILGALKAGGAYLPLDPAYPPDRLAFMLRDARVPVLLTQSRLAEQIPGLVGYDPAAASLELRGVATAGLETRPAKAVPQDAQSMPPLHIVRLDEDWPLIARKSARPPRVTATPDNLAYVIYTSGSTGQPKGTMLAHRGLSNLAEVQRQAFDVRSSSRVLQFSSLSFDASVWETFMALANGATLCLARQDVLASGVDLARLLRDQKITHATLPPSVLRVLPSDQRGMDGQAQGSADIEFPDLQVLVAAGEACTTDLVARWAPGRRFFNAYGPTETTVCASMHLCDPARAEPPPIGRPIGNFKLYVLDQNKQPVPVGVPGELYIGGIGLALGYLNRPELTTQRIIPDPFSKRAGARLYRTGDLVRYLPNGDLDFIGRIDQQVKIRGFRIELGEIESVLRQHPGVVECAVVPQEMGQAKSGTGGPEGPRSQRLVAYVVLATSQNGQEKHALTADALRALLRQSLPEYMVPSAFVALDALPLLPNGKVDRRALPEPHQAAQGGGFGNGSGDRERVPPRTPTEQALAALWIELLGVEQVGAEDNFFDLGGHSLLATQFVSRVQETMHVELPVRALFESPALSQLAQQIDTLRQSSSNELDAVLRALQQVQDLSEKDVLWMMRDPATGNDNPDATGRPRTEPTAAS